MGSWLSGSIAAPGPLHRYGLVIMSLSLGNEGLSWSGPEEAEEVERHYTAGLRRIAKELRERMLPDACLVLGGPYPNDDYDEHHLAVLKRVWLAMQSWSEVDHTIDFLQAAVHDGAGRWHKGCSVDAGHPNDQGHRQMFECVETLWKQHLALLWVPPFNEL